MDRKNEHESGRALLPQNETSIVQPPRFLLSKRFFVSILLLFGTIHKLGMRVNLNIAIVAMTSNKTIISHNQTIIEAPEFDWDSITRSLILGICSYGFLISICASFISLKLGGARTIGIAMAILSVLTVLSPFIVRFNLYLYMLCRILEGSLEATAYVSFAELWSQWAPMQDCSKLTTIAHGGSYIGAFVIYPVCGFVIQKYGWPAAFYVIGGSSFIWSLIWLTMVPNSPQYDKWINKEEVKYIMENKHQKQRPTNVMSTLKHIATSRCVWALGVCKFGYIIGHTFVITLLPMYIKDMTNVDIKKVGLISALPNGLCIFTVPLSGCLLDYLQNENIFTPSQLHKVFVTISGIVCAALLISVSQLQVNFTGAIICFIFFKMALTLQYIVAQIAYIYIAPQCAGLLAGFIMLFYSAGLFSGPMAAGFIVTNHKPEEWDTFLIGVAILSLTSAIVYILFGSAEPQPWSYSNPDQDANRDNSRQISNS